MFSAMRFFTLLIMVVFVAFSVRLSELVTGISNLSPSAYAKEAEKKEEDKPAKAEEHAEDDKGMSTPDVVEGKEGDAPKWRDASDSDFDLSDVKMEMFEDLSKRRENLEKMEKEYYMREALLKAAEKELERKYKELNALKSEIEGLLEQQSEEEKQRIASLVKIYEGMKPKDAARIFDTLDIDVLVSVLAKMSTRKVSPVLAAMNPERARTVTIMMAEEKTLPSL